MAENFPGPYVLKIFYHTTPLSFPSIVHVQQFNMDLEDPPDVGDDFSIINVKRRAGSPTGLDTVLSNYVEAFVKMLDDTGSMVNYAELWVVEAGTHNMSYVSTEQIGEAGTHASNATRVAGLEIYTFRTLGGGIMKAYIMEGVSSEYGQNVYSQLETDEQAFANWFTDEASAYFLALDNTYPHEMLRMSPGTHEATYKDRFR